MSPYIKNVPHRKQYMNKKNLENDLCNNRSSIVFFNPVNLLQDVMLQEIMCVYISMPLMYISIEYTSFRNYKQMILKTIWVHNKNALVLDFQIK